MSEILRVYFDPAEIGPDGYPYAWHRPTPPTVLLHEPAAVPPIKDLIREQAGHRCERCGHPYTKGQGLHGGFSPCDEQCTHGGPVRVRETGWTPPELKTDGGWRVYDVVHEPIGDGIYDDGPGGQRVKRWEIEASWRILTVHHLNRVKHDCRWWNLAALCQRCHLVIQGKVWLERPWLGEHSEWFKPHAAGWYAWSFLGLEPTREETMERLDEFLSLEHRQLTLE